ncbi:MULTISPECIES: hypothetical protein [unclassified Streptomyces]|uniref:hypothetical protein n=1 Tax=unclassified Streptomyces TaxID=2593676 RepID=UPI002E2F3DF9|nr:hypothetical protein [Streptomyces sp. NBC_01280]WSE11881.1 LysM peptidoglycan-binding domain-containing protein [Streptomyces sp. NBC_01397]WSE19745.1 LysM peptidoglycan-binding domain-containing protein [Streptomyces sp. NBC_01397]
MPDASASGTDAPARQGEHTRSVTAKAGDTLWDIADKEMGDGAKYPQLFDANKGAPQPGGGTLTDPDDIRAGLKLDIPQPAAPPAPPAPPEKAKPHPKPPSGPNESTGAGHGSDEGAGAHDKDKESRPAPHESGRQTAKPSAPAQTPEHDKPQDHGAQPPAATHTAAPKKPTAAPSPSAQPSKPHAPTTAPASTPQDDTTGTDEADESPVGVREAAGIGMLLAGSLLASVGIKRLLQRRRRRPGETIAIAEQPAPLEQVLEASAEPGSVELLDTALRTLNHYAQQEGRALPAILGARITHRTLDLLLDTGAESQAAAEPVQPFMQHKHSPSCWTLDRSHELLDHDQARAIPAPYPGLTTIGTDPDGNHLLLNLPAARVLLLDGDPDAVRDAARAIALETATSSWSDRADILTIGLGTELPTRLPQGRLRAVPHLRAAQRDLGELLLEHHQNPAGEDETAPLPWLLICAADAAADDAQHLADALTAARALPLALVLPARGAQHAFPHAEQLTVGSSTPQRLDLLDTDVLVQSMTDGEYQDLIGVLNIAEEPARPAEGPWQLVPAPAPDQPGHHCPASPSAVPDTPFTALTATTSLRSMPPPQQAAEDDAAHGPATTPGPEPVPQLAEQAPAEAEEDESEAPGPVDSRAPDIQVLGPVTVACCTSSPASAATPHARPWTHASPGPKQPSSPASPNCATAWAPTWTETPSCPGTAPAPTASPPQPAATGHASPSSPNAGSPRAQRAVPASRTWRRHSTSCAAGPSAAPTWPGPPPASRKCSSASPTSPTHSRPGTAPRPDLTAARHAVTRGLDIDDSAEILYQDWMLIEDQAGNRAGVSAAYETLRGVNQRLEIGMEGETEKVFDTIMSRTAS